MRDSLHSEMADRASSVLTQDEINEILRKELAGFVVESSAILLKELHRKKLWARDWLRRRETHGASAQLLSELRREDPAEYRACLRMSHDRFDHLLGLVESLLSKQNTTMRDALSAKLKLEITLSYLATGNSYRSLQHLFRVSKSAISRFIPEVCDAISSCLQEYIKVIEINNTKPYTRCPASTDRYF